jgi:hypothetical protein
MLVILKLPVVYLCAVVWWAIRAEPRPPEGAARLAITEPVRPQPWRRRRPPLGAGPVRRGPHGAPTRTYARRPAIARARVDP